MNFKKHISFLLALFLLVSNTGFAIDVHYCGGKIASLKPVYWKSSESISKEEESCCPPSTKSILNKKESCCKDKVVHFQKKSGKITLNSITFQPDFVFLIEDWNPFIFSEVSYFENNSVASYYCDANAPPLFKLYQQYIFYA
ncbi:HYC_CC_PP family protein [Flavobacterium sp.]|jgi:hypothetical protein|uniref:HYC_CC_PP family protein n=1 Tax=Flavobacterium sp. TaxID=239 RepID=UPI0037C0147B